MGQINFTALPFYNSVSEQNHRKSYAYGHIYPLYAMNDVLIPFQFPIRYTTNHNQKLDIFKPDGTLVASYDENELGAFFEFDDKPDDNVTIVIHKNTIALPDDLPIGQYYLGITIGTLQTKYSDILTCIDDTDNYLFIKWWDDEDFVLENGIISYPSRNYENILYLCTEIGKPEYVFEEEGESRDGYFFPIKQISEKKYHFVFTAPEYLLDAMRLIRMSDHVEITDVNSGYICDTFLMTPKWLEQGDLASVEVEFDTNTIAKKIGKGYANII